MTSEPLRNSCPLKVEKRLSRVCKKLKETEVKANVFGRMVKRGIPTADVRSFVERQARLKRVDQNINLPTVREAMKGKYSDTLAVVDKLRRSKRELKDDLINIHNYPKSKCRKLVKSFMIENEHHKERQIKRLNNKFEHCRKKMNLNNVLKTASSLPEDVLDIVKDVNIFSTEMVKEKSADPMVCDKNIKLVRD